MKLLLLIWLFIYCSTVVNGQDFIDYSFIDSKALQIPNAATYSTAAIADYMQANFKTDKEKIRAIYRWVTANIHYSKDSMFYRFWGEDPERKLSSILKTRKGVCEDYATLFSNLILKCNIPSFVVSGFTKIAGVTNPAGHSWCAVYADKEWLLCDPTWDESFSNAAHYFLVKPSQFIETHFPFDPLWQLQEHPVSHKEFCKGYTRLKNDEAVFHFADSVNSFLLLDTLQQHEAASRRMIQAGLDNESLQTWYAYNQMKIAIVYQENDMTIFNAAVADLNKAKFLYNDFVQYRNNRFVPARPDAAVNEVFNSIDSLVLSANKKANSFGKKGENYQYDTEALKKNLDELATKVQEQKNFFKKYFAANAADRAKLFYQQAAW